MHYTNLGMSYYVLHKLYHYSDKHLHRYNSYIYHYMQYHFPYYTQHHYKCIYKSLHNICTFDLFIDTIEIIFIPDDKDDD